MSGRNRRQGASRDGSDNALLRIFLLANRFNPSSCVHQKPIALQMASSH